MNLIETGYHEVNAGRDPDLGSHSVLAGSVKGFDAKVLLDPFEEEFDLPATLVYSGDGQGWQVEVVGQEDQPLTAYRIDIADTTQTLRVVEFPLPGAQPDRLVAAQSRALVHRTGFQNVELRVAFGSDHEVCLCLFNAIQTGEIEIATVDYIDASGIESDLIEEMDVVNRSIGNAHKHRDWAAQVELCVQFDGCFGSPEVCPREHRQTQIDGRGIDRINHLVEIEPIRIFGIEPPGLANEDLSERFVNPPVPMFVGVGQVGPGDVPANAHCVEMCATTQTGFDVPQALPKSNLREGHCEKLISGGHASTASLHRVKPNTTIELLSVNEVGDLGEYQSSSVHPLLRMNLCQGSQPVQMRHMHFSPLAAKNEQPTKP